MVLVMALSQSAQVGAVVRGLVHADAVGAVELVDPIAATADRIGGAVTVGKVALWAVRLTSVTRHPMNRLPIWIVALAPREGRGCVVGGWVVMVVGPFVVGVVIP